jgi:tRNA threonylcarbamoyladenosine biosynthesis protein TsaB
VGREEGDYIFPLLDARRMEVYTAGFTADKQQIAENQAKILDEASFREFLDKGRVTFIGNGVPKFREICTHENARFIEGKLPSAKEMASLAQVKFLEEDLEDVAYFEPYYLKDFLPG